PAVGRTAQGSSRRQVQISQVTHGNYVHVLMCLPMDLRNRCICPHNVASRQLSTTNRSPAWTVLASSWICNVTDVTATPAPQLRPLPLPRRARLSFGPG